MEAVLRFFIAAHQLLFFVLSVSFVDNFLLLEIKQMTTDMAGAYATMPAF